MCVSPWPCPNLSWVCCCFLAAVQWLFIAHGYSCRIPPDACGKHISHLHDLPQNFTLDARAVSCRRSSELYPDDNIPFYFFFRRLLRLRFIAPPHALLSHLFFSVFLFLAAFALISQISEPPAIRAGGTSHFTSMGKFKIQQSKLSESKFVTISLWSDCGGRKEKQEGVGPKVGKIEPLYEEEPSPLIICDN